MNFFNSSNHEENIKLNARLEDPENLVAKKNESMFKNITNMFSTSEVQNQPESYTDRVISMIEVEKSYTSFFVVLAFGFVVLFFSLMFLPFVILRPQKFVSLFSIGSFLIITSFIFIYGTKNYLNMLFNSSRRILTCLYLLSIFIGIYFSFNETYIIVSHICAILQLITLITFTLSFIPGGNMGISFMWNMFKSMFIRSSNK